ncbi:hypothetical protein ACHAXA_007089 [Cyclostephanos tholiformis]|uniref:Uncharacterized protein n=1 Tax=Cyclostephanos tholiformis TaxID=382380 RepID=A0ABD3RZ27_9STRA
MYLIDLTPRLLLFDCKRLSSHFTRAKIPVTTWELYTTREACCDANYPYSNICNGPLPPEPPTKHPTIVAPEENDYDIVPLRFDVTGLPDDVSIMDLKEQMETILTRIMLRLADEVEGLSVTNVEQTVPKSGQPNIRGQATAYFNVQTVHVEGSNYGPLIIQAVQDSYDELLDQI